MDNIWFNLFYPRNQFSRPPACAVTMQSQQSSIERIVKMILPFSTYLETKWIRCGSLTVRHITLMPLLQQNLRQFTSGSARTSPIAYGIDLQYSHLFSALFTRCEQYVFMRLYMLLYSTEMHVKFMKVLQKRSERRTLRHLGKGIHILGEALATIAKLAVRAWHIGMRVVDIAR